jgi:hypothetical protein
VGTDGMAAAPEGGGWLSSATGRAAPERAQIWVRVGLSDGVGEREGMSLNLSPNGRELTALELGLVLG